jgi:hypothetical protein
MSKSAPAPYDRWLAPSYSHSELGHGVRNLLEQDGTETGVETTDTLLPCDPGETAEKTIGKGRLGDEPDTGGLERAEGDVGEEFGDTGSSEVDGLTVVTGLVDAKVLDGGLFPELVTVMTRKADERSGNGR